jgi:hypothetical protein
VEHGQHISFYTHSALTHLARANGVVLASNNRDLHFFMRPDLIPKRIEARWLWRWLNDQTTDVRTLVQNAYSFVKYPHLKMGMKQALKNIYYRKQFPGFYLRSPTINPEVLGKLGACSLTRAYAKHLLSNNGAYWIRIAPLLKSRVMDDQILMRAKMHSSPT